MCTLKISADFVLTHRIKSKQNMTTKSSENNSEIFCEICGVSYFLRQYLSHMKSHEGGKPIVANFTAQALSGDQKTAASRSHNKKMNLTCEICGKEGITSELN